MRARWTRSNSATRSARYGEFLPQRAAGSADEETADRWYRLCPGRLDDDATVRQRDDRRPGLTSTTGEEGGRRTLICDRHRREL